MLHIYIHPHTIYIYMYMCMYHTVFEFFINFVIQKFLCISMVASYLGISTLLITLVGSCMYVNLVTC